MSVPLLHHRLAVVTALMALISYAGGAGPDFVGGMLAAPLLAVAFFWRPSNRSMEQLERLWLPIAILLVARAAYHAFVVRDDVVLPVVDLLLLLLVAEAFRADGAQNDARLYSLSFALVLAATAYRPGPLFLFGFAGFLVVGTAGLMVGHLKRQARAAGQSPPDITRRFLAAAVGLAGGVLLVSAIFFVVFPRASRAWPGRAGAPATTVAGFQDRVSIGDHGASIQANPAVAFRVEFPSGRPPSSVPLHWRGRSYDRFDGQTWSRSRSLPVSRGQASWYEERWGGVLLEQSIYASRMDVPVLFALSPLIRVSPESPIQPVFDNAGDFNYWGTTAPVYNAFSIVSRPSPEDLRATSGRYYPGRGAYLQLPALDFSVPVLADSLTRNRPTRYDKVVAVLDFLRTEFTYTLELPGSPREATLQHFLFERRAGHCEYFSTAMVILLRSVGIHSREVNGFLGGEWNGFGSYLAVTQNQAHTWTEVWFPEIGWVPFDPTPAGGAGQAAELSWFWPGQFLLDGLRHRWNKWVLDYDTGAQLQILGSVREAMGTEASARDERPSALRWLLLAFGLITLIWVTGEAVRRMASRRTQLSAESVLFVKLRHACALAGVPDADRLSASALAGAVEEAGISGAAAVRRFAHLYLRARFRRGGPTEVEMEEIRDAQAAARSALRGPSLVGRA